MSTDELSAQQRGYLLVRGIVEAHLAAIEALRIVKGSKALEDRLAVLLHEHYDYSPSRRKEIAERTKNTIERARKQAQDDFQYLRKTLLISLCSALELTVKEVVVEGLMQNTQFWAALSDEMENASDLDEAKRTDYSAVFDFVDRNLDLKHGPKIMRRRGNAATFRYWLNLVASEPPPGIKSDQTINQAFGARNLAIHGSVRARKRLRETDSAFLNKNGDLVITQEAITRVRDAIQGFVEGIGLANL